MFDTAFKDGKYVLPDLPYKTDALAPHYDARTLQIHHDRHHAGYVKGLNTVLDKLSDARTRGNFAQVQAYSRALAFHGSGHMLHTLFWNSMKPPERGSVERAMIPSPLDGAMKKSFGSVKTGMDQFAAATKAVEGSGWGILAYEPVGDRIVVLQCENHQNLTIWGVQPLLCCDVWEHAYYLEYQNKRSQWVDAFMNIANWDTANDLYKMARQA
ncbi:MAG: superoxide dismutase [Phycisphaerae bacterium]